MEEHSVNRFVLVIVTVIDLFIFFGYIGDFLKGNISLGLLLVVDVVVAVSLILDYAVYMRNHESRGFKYISLIGYMLVYVPAVFGSQNDLVFIMVFPITVLFILYYDYKLIFYMSLVFGITNLLDVAYAALLLKHMHSGAELNPISLLLQGASAVVYLIVLCGTTKISNQNNNAKLESIKEEQEHSARLLEDVLTVVASVKENTAQASAYIATLSSNVALTAAALNDISMGNSSNTESIERQTSMTEKIQVMIQQTKGMSDQMLQYSEQSREAVRDGQEAVEKLRSQSDRTESANRQVVSSVESLIENAKNVSKITNEISDISAQTNLLALNASIESARAGEAGRGFAVVAEEIRALADKSRGLTEAIQKLMVNLQTNADMARDTVDNVMEVAGQEREMIVLAADKFVSIGDSIEGLNQNVGDIYRQIDEIVVSNDAIVESITQISSVSQEVAASTLEAVKLGDDCTNSAKKAKELMEELVQSVHAIDKYEV